MIGGGRGILIPILTSTSAMAEIGVNTTSARKIIPKKNFFIVLSPFSSDVAPPVTEKGGLTHG